MKRSKSFQTQEFTIKQEKTLTINPKFSCEFQEIMLAVFDSNLDHSMKCVVTQILRDYQKLKLDVKSQQDFCIYKTDVTTLTNPKDPQSDGVVM